MPHSDESDPDRPRLVLNRANYPKVENAHIVPRMYQRAFEVAGKVAVHAHGASDCVLISTKTAGTRSAYYRRTRPDGGPTDDVEASLAFVEDRAAKPLRRIIGGEPTTAEHKGIVAQFIAVQMLRGPAFFKQREQVLVSMIEELEPDDFTAEGLIAAAGDVETARKRAIEQNLNPTHGFMSMLTRSAKLASIFGYMRWNVVRFDRPVLAYSDQPVAMWPMNVETMHAASEQQFGPLAALEVRVPLAPDVAVLMDWVDRSDQYAVSLEISAASEFNAFTVAQADREWMHRPAVEPEIANGPHEPLSRRLEPGYDQSVALRSARRYWAQQYIAGVQGRRFVNTVEVLTDVGAV